VAAVMLLAPFAFAGGSFNFGTMQGGKLIAIEPGKTAEAKLYFFNIHGDRDTHVSIGVVEAPAGFKVEIDPMPHNASYNVSGVMITTTESLVTPVTPVDSLPKEKPEESATPAGVEYVTLGGVEGFVPAKVLTIRVTAPADAPLWQDYTLKLAATAGWFDVGETGPISVRQARDFTYGIRTITKEYSEEAVAEQQKPFWEQLDAWMVSTAALVLVILVLAAYVLFSRKKKK